MKLIKKRGNFSKILLESLLVIFLIGIVSSVPHTISFNGKLLDSSGNPITGTNNVSFKIYDSYSGGNLLWSDEINVTTDSSGVCNAVLSGINTNFSDQYYLGIAVGSDPEMSPRINLSSSPYSFAADSLRSSGNIEIEAANIVRIFVNSSNGYVGIGTTDPLWNLDVEGISRFGSTTADYPIRINSSDNKVGAAFYDNNYAGYITVESGYFSIGGNTGLNNINLNINLSSGNVGIGTTSPTVSQTKGLEISAANAGIRLTPTAAGGWGYIEYPNSTGRVKFITGFRDADETYRISAGNTFGSTGMTFDTEGNVGIGTTSPKNELNVIGEINATSTIYTPELCLDGDCQTTWGAIVSGSGGWNTTGDKVYLSNTSAKVGIGTDSPDEELHVLGSIKARKTEVGTQDNLLKILSTQDSGSSDTTWRGRAIYGADNITVLMGVYKGYATLGAHTWTSADAETGAGWGDLHINPNGDAAVYIGESGHDPSTANMIIDNSNDRVGIGTVSPGAKLDVRTSDSWNDPPLRIGSDDGNEPYVEFKSGTSAFGISVNNSADDAFKIYHGTGDNNLVLNNGNVGIGTTSPDELLEVWGDSGDTRIEVTKDGSGYVQLGYDTIGSYIYERDASNPFRIYTGGQEQVRIQSDGNVGIGTTGPSAPLTIKSGGKNSDVLQIVNESNSVIARFLEVSDGSGRLIIEDENSENQVTISGNGDSWFNNGNVGIGTTAPNAKLQVKGKVTIGSNNAHHVFSVSDEAGITNGGDVGLYYNSNDRVVLEPIYNGDNDGDFKIYNQYSSGAYVDWMYFKNNGNVGIGTTNPLYDLHIKDSDSTASLHLETDMVNGYAEAYFENDARLWKTGIDNNDYFRIRDDTAAVNRLVIDTDGNVGIGTTAPGSALHIEDNIDVSSVNELLIINNTADQNSGLSITSGNPSGDYWYLFREQTGRFAIYDSDGTAGERFVIQNNSGNVGIGTTSPDTDLHIESATPTLRLTDSDNNADAEIYGGSGSVGIRADVNGEFVSSVVAFEIDGSEKVRIDKDGNVGIGTTAPGEKLEVAGNINSTGGDICISGGACLSSVGSSGANVTGTGTSNYIPKWTGVTSLGDSSIKDDGTTITIEL